MLRIAGTAAIAEEHDLATAANAANPGIQHAPERGTQRSLAGRGHGEMLLEFALEQIHGRHSYPIIRAERSAAAQDVAAKADSKKSAKRL
jgi:hypothetical protein